MICYAECLFYRSEQTYSDVADWLIANGHSDTLIVADNARPEGIFELRQRNLNVYPTKKNTKGGSVADTIKLVQEYDLKIDDKPLSAKGYEETTPTMGTKELCLGR